MRSLKQRLLTNWHLMRIVRAGIGLMLLVMAFQNKDWPIGLFSTFFLFQAATDTGCCGTKSCCAPEKGRRLSSAALDKDISTEYEEVK